MVHLKQTVYFSQPNEPFADLSCYIDKLHEKGEHIHWRVIESCLICINKMYTEPATTWYIMHRMQRI